MSIPKQKVCLHFLLQVRKKYVIAEADEDRHQERVRQAHRLGTGSGHTSDHHDTQQRHGQFTVSDAVS